MRKILFIGSLLLFASCGYTTKQIKVSTPGYETNVDVYSTSDPKKQHNQLAFIVLHPKSSKGRTHPGVTHVAAKLSHAGHTAYAPNMPYAEYSGTLTEGFKLIDALAERAAKANKKVIITGHSMGAAVALLYASAYTPHKNVTGIVLMAPGHLLQLSKIEEVTALSVVRARKMVKQGQGDEIASFNDFNQGRKSSISTTADIYRSYFDPKLFPNPATHLEDLKVPMLWIDGEWDLSAARKGHVHLYGRGKAYPQNLYMEVPAGHFDVPWQSSGPILQWAKHFE